MLKSHLSKHALVIPWVWSLWIALLTAELTAVFPVAGTRARWIVEAFGPGWGFFATCLGAFSNTFDTALYPVMFLAYWDRLGVTKLGGLSRGVGGSMLVMVALACNLRGINMVGWVNVIFLGIVVGPFVAMALLGIDQLSPATWLRDAHMDQVQWIPLLVVLTWNTSGYENVANSCMHVRSPSRTIPMAMFITIGIATAIYTVPVAVGVAYKPNYAEWEEGYFVEVASQVGGRWLGILVVITACFGSMGLLIAMLLCSAESFVSLGHAGLLGPQFKGKAGASRLGLCAVALMVVLLIMMDFTTIVTLSMTLYAAQMLGYIAALIQLRARRSDVDGDDVAFRIPLSFAPLCAVYTVPAGICMALIFFNDWFTLAVTGTTMAAAGGVWHAWFARRAVPERGGGIGGEQGYGELVELEQFGEAQ